MLLLANINGVRNYVNKLVDHLYLNLYLAGIVEDLNHDAVIGSLDS